MLKPLLFCKKKIIARQRYIEPKLPRASKNRNCMEKRLFFRCLAYILNVHYYIIVGIIQERVKPARRTYFFKTISGKQHHEGENLNQKKPTIMEYLAFLSVKQGIYLSELYQAMVEAREKGKTTCQNLLVEYRCSVKDEAIFLITKDYQSNSAVSSC